MGHVFLNAGVNLINKDPKYNRSMQPNPPTWTDLCSSYPRLPLPPE